jgi:hypothetical protein
LMARPKAPLGEPAEDEGDPAHVSPAPIQGELMPFLVARDKVAQECRLSPEAAAQHILVRVRQGTLLAFSTRAKSPALTLKEPQPRTPGDWYAPIRVRWGSHIKAWVKRGSRRRWRSWVEKGRAGGRLVEYEAILWGDLRHALIAMPAAEEQETGTGPAPSEPAPSEPAHKKRSVSFDPEEKRLDQEAADQAVGQLLSSHPRASQNWICGKLQGQELNGRVLKRDQIRQAYDRMKPSAKN